VPMWSTSNPARQIPCRHLKARPKAGKLPKSWGGEWRPMANTGPPPRSTRPCLGVPVAQTGFLPARSVLPPRMIGLPTRFPRQTTRKRRTRRRQTPSPQEAPLRIGQAAVEIDPNSHAGHSSWRDVIAPDIVRSAQVIHSHLDFEDRPT